ncbi:MAG: transposase, partial [Spirochaetota bacterium]|nr:transposase [Spirochaetota bacterium]
MARPLRIEYPGAFYHVFQHGIEQKQIFATAGDRLRFFHYLGKAHTRYGLIVHSFVLMTTHYHLILETPRSNLSQIMHYLNMSYAAYFNSVRKRLGPVFRGRFKAILVQQDEYLHQLSRYIHLNPVRAGIVRDPLKYQGSSLKFFLTGCQKPKWLETDLILSIFDDNPRRARKLYRDFILEGIGKKEDIVRKHIKEGCILGNDEFFERI